MAVAGFARFAQLLRQYRRAAGLTQEALAERAGVSVDTISNLERGVRHVPRPDTLDLLADALGLTDEQRQALYEAAHASGRTPGPQADAGDSASAVTRGRIPIPPTPLIGREAEIAALGALLRAQEDAEARVRLLTLVGPPGVGKTRLALEAARHTAGAFRDGVAWVNLAPLSDARLVAGTIAQALDIRQQGAEPVEMLLQRQLQDKDLLLLLDNFEHLLPAASLIAELLATCPKVCWLITSRAPLHVRGEQAFPVAPLAMPDLPDPETAPQLEALAQNPAVALFVARGREVLPAFALSAANAPEIVAICRRLDGLPLALELAAARLNVLSPAALLALLEHRLPILTGGPHDLPAHQQTLRGTLAWSYDLLAGDEQTLFRRLAVFAGGAPLAAVAPVCCGSQETGPEVLNRLSALLDHHLLTRMQETGEMGGEPRYGMLETIREYAWAKLHQHDEATAVQRAHAYYYLALAEEAEPKLRGPEQATWLARLETEHDNLRAALRWALTHRALPLALHSAEALSRFWRMRGYFSEGRRWLEELLALADSEGTEQADEPLRAAYARTLNAAGVLAHMQSDYARATALYSKSLALHRLLGDTDRVVSTLRNLSVTADAQGEVERAAALRRECLDLLGEGGDVRLAALVLNDLGFFHHQRGEYPLARELYSASLAKMQAVGDQRGIASALGNLGLLARDEGDNARAAQLLEDGLEQHRALRDKVFAAQIFTELGDLARRQGEVMRAQQLIEEGLDVMRRVGDQRGIGLALVYLGRVACDQGNPGEAAELFAEGLRLYVALPDQRSAILCLEGLANAAAAEQRAQAAVRLLGAAAALREALGTPLPVADRSQHDRILVEMRAALGEASFAATWEAGRNLSFDEAVAEALEEATSAPTEAPAPGAAVAPELARLHVRSQRDAQNGSGG